MLTERELSRAISKGILVVIGVTYGIAGVIAGGILVANSIKAKKMEKEEQELRKRYTM